MMAKFYTEQQVNDYFKKVKKYILDKGLVTACDIFPEELRLDAVPIEMFVLAEVKKDTEVIIPYEHAFEYTFPAPTTKQTYNTLSRMMGDGELQFELPERKVKLLKDTSKTKAGTIFVLSYGKFNNIYFQEGHCPGNCNLESFSEEYVQANSYLFESVGVIPDYGFDHSIKP